METNVVIQNFRCFEKIKISDLARVNLIGGKNNAGKTSLLEALLLSYNPYLSTIIFLNKYIRKESQKFYESMLTEVWSSLFLKKEHKIYLLGKYDNGNERSITISLNNIFLELEFSIFDPLHNLLENQNENISRGDYLRVISERSLNNTLTLIHQD